LSVRAPGRIFEQIIDTEEVGLSRSSGRASDSRRSGGFSLLELAIVLVMAGLVMGFAGLTFSGYFQRSSAKRAAQVFAGDLTLARSAATRSREAVVLRFYEEGGWYRIQMAGSGTELVRRRFRVNADVDLSAIDLVFRGDSVLFSPRGVVNLENIQGRGSLGEARFSSGSTMFKVYFNSLGASKVREGE
jgi:Tfp pilus assembly protein FimT